MNFASAVVAAVLVILFILAVRQLLKNKGGCAGCGHTGSCDGGCNGCGCGDKNVAFHYFPQEKKDGEQEISKLQ